MPNAREWHRADHKDMAHISVCTPEHHQGVEQLFLDEIPLGYPKGVTADTLSSWLWRSPLIASWVAVAGNNTKEDGRRVPGSPFEKGLVVGHLGLASAVDSQYAAMWCDATGVTVDKLAVGVRGLVARTHRGKGVAAELAQAQYRYVEQHQLVLVTDTIADRKEAIARTENAGFTKIGEATYVTPDGETCLKFLWARLPERPPADS